jgi:hypothetical protein
MNKQNNDIILAASLLSIATSIYLYASGRKEAGIFVGLWAPTFLGLGSFLNEARSVGTAVSPPATTPAQ